MFNEEESILEYELFFISSFLGLCVYYLR